MFIKINLDALLQTLQNLDVQQVTDEILVELATYIYFVKEAEKQLPPDTSEHDKKLISQIKELSIQVQNELNARGIPDVNISRFLDENPEIISEVFYEMPILQFIDLYNQLQQSAAADPDYDSVYQLASEIMAIRLGSSIPS